MKKLILTLIVTGSQICAVMAQVIFYVQQPPALEGNHDLSWAQWALTPDLNNPANAIIDTLVFVDDGTAADSLGCNTLVNDAQVAGKIAVVYRGTCQFGVKSMKAQNAGAVGVVIINNVPGAPIGMAAGTDGDNVTIPVVMITNSSGAILRDEIIAGNVVAFIGSKAGYFAKDVGFDAKDILLPPALANPITISSNSNEFSVPIQGWIFNYGSAAQNNVVMTANISYSGNNIYSNSSNPANINPGDSAFFTFPTFSLPSYPGGRYTLEYIGSSPDTDQFPADNIFRIDFSINDTVFAYVPLDTVNNLPVSTAFYRPSNNPGEFEECIHFRDTFGSRLTAKGIYFAASTTATDSLTGVYIETNLYKWGDVFTDINDPALNISSLTAVAYGSYSYSANLQDDAIYVPFDASYQMTDYERYLFCVKTYDTYVYLGFNTQIDYDEHINSYYLQPVSLVNDNGTWYAMGFGSDVVASVGVKFDPPPITATNVVKPTCPGNCDGYLSIAVSAGVPPYTYTWSNGQSSSTITGLCAGLFTVTVTDNVGTTSMGTFAVTDHPPVIISIIPANVSCVGSCDGSAISTVSGGTSPYFYLWNDPQAQTTLAATGLCMGIFTVTVSDTLGCTAIDSVTILNPPPAVIIDSKTDILCVGSCDGTASIVASCGVLPYTYLWNDPGSQTTAAATGLCTGSWEVSVTDSLNNSVVATVIIGSPDTFTSTVAVINISCNPTGSINLSVTGGTAPYSYTWVDLSDTSIIGTTEDVDSLNAGDYALLVSDANGCLIYDTASIIQSNQVEIVNGAVINSNCGYDGSIDLSVSQGTQPYTFTWSDGSNTEDIANITAGYYTVTVMDADGCVDSSTFNVPGATDTLVAMLVSVQQQTINITVTGGTTPYTFNWSSGDTVEDPGPLAGGTYAVTVTDANGCLAYQSGIVVTGIWEVTAGYSINVNPNPGAGKFFLTIEMPKSSEGTLFGFTVRDVIGRTITSWNDQVNGNYSRVIDLVLMPQGIYTVNINTLYGNKVTRIVKF